MKALQIIFLTMAITMLFVGNALREQQAYLADQSQKVSEQIETIWLSGQFTSENVRPIYDELDNMTQSSSRDPWLLRYWSIISPGLVVLSSIFLLLSIHRDSRNRKATEQAGTCDAEEAV